MRFKKNSVELVSVVLEIYTKVVRKQVSFQDRKKENVPKSPSSEI